MKKKLDDSDLDENLHNSIKNGLSEKTNKTYDLILHKKIKYTKVNKKILT